jgi:hypothetical protein
LLREEANKSDLYNSWGHEKTEHKNEVDFAVRIRSQANSWVFSNSSSNAREVSFLSLQKANSGRPSVARKDNRSELNPKPRGKSSVLSLRKKTEANVSEGPVMRRKNPSFRFAKNKSKDREGKSINKKSFDTREGTPMKERRPRRK